MPILNMHEHMFGNFKDRSWRKRGKNSRFRQDRPGMSDAHLKRIRDLPCVICGWAPPSQAHHLVSGPAKSERGMSIRATDRRAIPLCGSCHEEGALAWLAARAAVFRVARHR